jgi:hypothetical protein
MSHVQHGEWCRLFLFVLPYWMLTHHEKNKRHVFCFCPIAKNNDTTQNKGFEKACLDPCFDVVFFACALVRFLYALLVSFAKNKFCDSWYNFAKSGFFAIETGTFFYSMIYEAMRKNEIHLIFLNSRQHWCCCAADIVGETATHIIIIKRKDSLSPLIFFLLSKKTPVLVPK